MPSTSIMALLLDVGGVLLTNGWDREMRARAAKNFSLNSADMEERHAETAHTYEVGKLSLDEYLNRVVFYQKRSFTREQFKEFLFAQSEPHRDMINLVRELRAHFGLKVAVVTNEGREITVHRIQKFTLWEFVDFFVASCFVHYRKPDADIYRIALDIAQVPPERVVYLEDRPLFVEVAQSLGIWSIHHRSFESTRAALDGMGLSLNP